MIVKNRFLDFKNTYIYQDNDLFCFSLDSILLANFVEKVIKHSKILDLCSGNIPIPIVLSKKFNCYIDAVEIQKSIYDLAYKTLKINKLDNKVRIFNIDLKLMKQEPNLGCYDIVTVNPPYFKYEKDSFINLNYQKAVARHELLTNIDDILTTSKYVLKNKGKLFLISRSDRMNEILIKAVSYNLIPKKIRFVYKNINSKSELFLLECVKNGKDTIIVDKPLVVYNNGNYSDEVKAMFGD